MKKALLVVIGLFLFTSLSFAGQETIKDDNDGNKGDIFVNTGTQQGNNDIGHWTDITTIPELKGEQGVQGVQGIAGFDGLNGINGLDGQNGLDGYTPIKGVDYFDGLNGEDGLDFDPAEVIRLDGRIDTETFDRIGGDYLLQDNIDTETTARIKGDNKLHNEIVDETNDRKTADKVEKKARILGDKKLQNNINTETTGRINGDNFLNSRINDTNIVVDSHSKTLQDHENRISNLNGRVGDLEATQYNVEGVLRILDTKKTTIEIYNTYDTAHSREVAVGVRVTYKLGKSYQDKLNEKTEARLFNLEKQIGNSPIITKVVENGKTKSISISANGLAVSGNF